MVAKNSKLLPPQTGLYAYSRGLGRLLSTQRWLQPAVVGRRTYARPSRRQSSTPDIPRPHRVPLARVVFCVAHPYDQGYLAPEDIAGRVRVRGRGGTVLQPAINLLGAAEDFPEKGPLLIITDGECDVVKIRREHAFLMPRRGQLPFEARGKVFRL